MKHAFAVDDSGPIEPTPEQQPAVDWLCRQVTKRHLTTPGLIALEMGRPLNYIGAHVMHFFEPAIYAIASRAAHEHYQHLARFLEHRGSIDYLCRRIEALEAESDRAKTTRTKTTRAKKTRAKKTRRSYQAPDVPETDE